MALYGSGRNTGVSLSIGGGLTQCIPIVHGYPVLTKTGTEVAMGSLAFGGKDVTKFLGNCLMPHRGSSLLKQTEYELIQNVQETVCFVPDTANRYDEYLHDPVESQVATLPASRTLALNCAPRRGGAITDTACCELTLHPRQASYTMPDGMALEIGFERFKAGETLFRPELGVLPKGQGSITDLVWGTCSKVENAVQAELFNNIVLSGSLSLMTGLNTRLANELSFLSHQAGADIVSRVIAKPERKYLEWIGASITATLSSFAENWITKEEYAEAGDSIFERKGMFVDLRRGEDEAYAWERPLGVLQPMALEPPEAELKRNASTQNMQLWRASIEGSTKALLEALEKQGVEKDAGDPSNEGMTALHFACRYGNSDTVDCLLKNGVDIALCDDYGKTALHWAVSSDKSFESVGYLIGGGVDVNTKDRLGRTALHYAAQAGFEDTIALLLKAGADREATDRTFRTPVDWALSDAAKTALNTKSVAA